MACDSRTGKCTSCSRQLNRELIEGRCDCPFMYEEKGMYCQLPRDANITQLKSIAEALGMALLALGAMVAVFSCPALIF